MARNVDDFVTADEHALINHTGIPGVGGGGGVADAFPIGAIVPYGATVASIPSGWLACDGTEYDQTVEADLFSVIGSVWNTGGETPGFFRVPDFRHRTVAGINDGTLPAGADGGFTTRALADTTGSETHSHTVNSHTHGISSDGSHTHSGTTAEGGVRVTSGLDATYPGNDGINGTHVHTFTTSSNGSHNHSGVTGTASPNTDAQSSLAPTAFCPYIIKAANVGGGVGGVSAQLAAGPVQGPQPTLNFIQSGATSISVVENVGQNRIDITISSTDTADLSTYETGSAATAALGGGAGTYTINAFWPGTFTPHGLICVVGSSQPQDNFFSVGFCRGNTSGIQSQSHILHDFGGSAAVSSLNASLVSISNGTLVAQTPAANQWDVQRSGISSGTWTSASMVLGRATV